MNKLQRIEEMERQLAALKAEVEQEEEQKQWEPEGGGFVVGCTGETFAFGGSPKSCVFGAVRKTEEQAEKAAKAMRTHNRLLAYVAEFAPDWEPSYNDSKCTIVQISDSEFTYAIDLKGICIGTVYMPKHVAEELCRKLNNGEVVL